jgi:N-acetylglucosamine-6-phosphate deacetylase
VTVAGGEALLTGTQTLAGSTLTLDAALRNAIDLVRVDPVLAVGALTASPARALGLDDRLGYLRVGYTADAVLLDAGWHASDVYANGQRVA